MLVMGKKYGFHFDEYFMYKFYERPLKERLEFVPDFERIDIIQKFNHPKNQAIFDNKAETYLHFKEFYYRDVAMIHTEDELKAFSDKHASFIIKVVDGSCGHGTRIVRKNDLQELLTQYPKGFIAEELIDQDDSLSQFHPKSVNTLRVTTLRLKDGTHIVHPFIRFGRGDSVVDNGGAGGIMCAMDADSGIILAAADEHGHHYQKHPETGIDIVGFQIPRWEEAKDFVRKLAEVIPENRYTGWDIALTKNGWCMVEGNARGQFVGWQIPLQQGFRKEMEHYLSMR